MCFVCRRQSSGSSFLSKSEADGDDQVGSFSEKYDPPPADPFLPPLPVNKPVNCQSNEGTVSSDSKWSVVAFDCDVPLADEDPAEDDETSVERQTLGRLSFLMDDKIPNGGSCSNQKPLTSTTSVETNASGSSEFDKRRDLQSTGAIPKKNRPSLPSSGSSGSSMNRFSNPIFDKDDKKKGSFFKKFKLSDIKSTYEA